uniref:J domain-containing protein n=1 Tax=Glossina pallidipes TaxID=7398 RepID=A0A1A9Z4F4_GLOPL
MTMNLSELDYYTILNVKRSATKGEIYLAYRKLAIRLNPYRDPKHCKEFVPLAEENQLTHMSPLGLNKQWAYINMALDVLGAYSSGNDLYRSIYDRYGEAGLIQGVLLPNGYFPPYNYHGDHMKVYHEVFGTYSPYANVMDPITNPPPLYTNKNNGIGVRTKEPPVEKTVALSLEDVYFGCVKLMHVWRQEFIDKEELTTEKRKKTLTLNIPPGITAGTRFSFKEEGDRFPTKIPSDIIFIVEDKPHDVFKRRNLHNIVYTHEITLCQALTGFRFVIETLDKRKIKVSISDVVSPDYIKILPNEGLPKYKSVDDISKSRGVPSYEYGDLIIEFKKGKGKTIIESLDLAKKLVSESGPVRNEIGSDLTIPHIVEREHQSLNITEDEDEKFIFTSYMMDKKDQVTYIVLSMDKDHSYNIQSHFLLQIMSGNGQEKFILKTCAYNEKRYSRSSSSGPLRIPKDEKYNFRSIMVDYRRTEIPISAADIMEEIARPKETSKK